MLSPDQEYISLKQILEGSSHFNRLRLPLFGRLHEESLRFFYLKIVILDVKDVSVELPHINRNTRGLKPSWLYSPT